MAASFTSGVCLLSECRSKTLRDLEKLATRAVRRVIDIHLNERRRPTAVYVARRLTRSSRCWIYKRYLSCIQQHTTAINQVV